MIALPVIKNVLKG